VRCTSTFSSGTPAATAAVAFHERGAVHRLERRVVEEGRVILGLDPLRGRGERGLDLAVVPRHRNPGILQAEAHELADARSGGRAVRARVPFDRQELQHLARAPPVVGDYRDRVLELHHADEAAQAQDPLVWDGNELPAEHRALRDGGVGHAGELHVDAEHRLADHLVVDVEAVRRAAEEVPVLGVLELHLARRLELRGGGRDLAEADLPARRSVNDGAVLSVAVRRVDLPALRRGGDQHLARGRAGLAEVFLRSADRLAAAGRHRAPDAVAAQVLRARDELGAHFSPVALELLGDQHRQPRRAALPHLRARDADQDLVIGPDHDPGGELGAFRFRGERRGGQRQLEGEPSAERGGNFQEIAAGKERRGHESRANTLRVHCILPLEPSLTQALADC
jgi:hypothetical protein